jgi:CHAT domain-containing protein
LVQRFYQNLLGKRSDLKRPMPKADALAEAKRWLRSLTREQLGKEQIAMARGSVGERPRTVERDSNRPHTS